MQSPRKESRGALRQAQYSPSHQTHTTKALSKPICLLAELQADTQGGYSYGMADENSVCDSNSVGDSNSIYPGDSVQGFPTIPPFFSDSSSSSDSDNPFSEANIIQWFMDDTLSKLIKLRRELLEKEASSSRRRRRPRRVIERNREEAHQRLYNDYFSNSPTYTDDIFRRRFRMRRHLFLRIVEGVANYDKYFHNSVDATGRQSFSPLQKCTAAMRVLAYGTSANAVDEYLQLGESTTKMCIERFVQAINVVFGDEYLRRPNDVDLQRLMHIGEQKGFPGMLGSIDCMHWEWENCPTAWCGQYARANHRCPTIMLEAVASSDLWIWHAFFGLVGTSKDINVLDRSPIFHEVLEGKAPQVNFFVNGNQYNLGYYLADEIYPNWANFVKSISLPQNAKHKLFTKKQDGARKDMNRAFKVLRARFAIISNPSRKWCKEILGQIMRACIVMHNMIVEDERDSYDGDFDYTDKIVNANVSMPENARDSLIRSEEYIRDHAQIHNSPTNPELQEDLIEEIWDRFGGDEMR